MCASYGLDPRFKDDDYAEALDADLLLNLRSWADRNAGETLRPTGRNLRNLNPIVTATDGTPTLELAWWGYLVDGEPAKFPSINTRAERLQQRPAGMSARAIVPATRWFEMQKSSRTWYGFGAGDDQLLGLAAVTQRGRTGDGASFTCYSIVMRTAPVRLAGIHDRMPLLIPPEFASQWLGDTGTPARELIDDALGSTAAVDEVVAAAPLADRP